MGSHTATGEWQSFELRMRRRRAERLVLRAEVAADAGFPDDARTCLDEARRLAPGLTAIASVQEKLDAPPAAVAEPPAAAPRRLRPGLAGAGVFTAAACALAIYAWAGRATPIPP